MDNNNHVSGKVRRRPNRLSKEKSPYLLQHALNPVDWYPWAEEALDKAKKENRPIFLSIGYSSCHWCHVMEKESFEDEEVAKLLNENFIPIKVDREERQDIDEIYMKAVTAMTGSGGWPLNVFLTSDLEPFFGGTYFPPTTRYGMPSFSQVLRSVIKAWDSDRQKILDSAAQMTSALQEMYSQNKSSREVIGDSVIEDCFQSLARAYDEEYGGFGNSPKFPMPSYLFFLLRYYARNKSKLALNMATKTMIAMASGGIHDQIGGGFHRYSTDRYWIVPHFEKMLYDNALLAIAYTEAYLITKDDSFADVVRGILNWILREMVPADGSGGFYSALDADSPEGEGSFYVWDTGQVADALKQTDNPKQFFSIAASFFSVTTEGNFENGKSILTKKPLKSVSEEFKISEEKAGAVISETKQRMLQHRNNRPKTLTDDKILTSWNGLAISAMSKAYQALDDSRYLDSAIRAADLILSKLSYQDERTGLLKLFRRFREGEVRGEGLLEDYSFLANGLMDLYESTFDSKYLRSSVMLTKTMISLFYDNSGGGFYQTEEKSNDLIARAKDAYDGAIPSGNSIAALLCARLAEATSDYELKETAIQTVKAFWRSIIQQPSSFAQMIIAIDFILGKTKEIVVSGQLASPKTQSLLRILWGSYLPNAVVLYAQDEIRDLTPIVQGRVAGVSEDARVFVCQNFICKLPSKTGEDLLKALE